MNKRILSILVILLFSQTLQAQVGKFYASLSDYLNDSPIPGYVIKPQERKCSPKGDKFLIGPDVASAKYTKASEFPSDLFTYDNYYSFVLVRADGEKCYMVLSHGKLCFYAWFFAQEVWYYSETITGEMKQFDEDVFKDYLNQFGLLEDYQKEDPKKLPKESDNDFFNRQTSHVKKYFDLLNKEME